MMAWLRRLRTARNLGLRLTTALAALLFAVGLMSRLSVGLSGSSPTGREHLTLGNVLALGTDLRGQPLFEDVLLVPGEPRTACIRLDAEGRVDPEPVGLYVANLDGHRGLAEALRLTVEYGTGHDPSTAGSCEGFRPADTLASAPLATLFQDHGDGAGALRAWDPRPGLSSTWYRFTVELPSDPPAAAQGGRIDDLGLAWATTGTGVPQVWSERSLLFVTSLAERSTLPLLTLLALSVVFLGIHNRIDGRDPKLAQAPSVRRELEFREPAGRAR